MTTIHEIKQQEITQTPIVLFDCELATGQVERWSTHAVTFEGNSYAARVLRHNAFELRAGSEDGIDTAARIGIVLANADSHFSQIERTTGFKGARTTVRFVFFDLRLGTPTSEVAVLFRGVADAPDEITETTFRLSLGNTLNLQRVLLPDVRIQKRCPWHFPKSADQRAEAVDGGTEGTYSRFWRCGYSPTEADGAGSTDAGTPFASCDGTRSQCEARGMFSVDALGRETKRFGGIEYVPPSITVRSYGERGSHTTNTVENEARYNDFVPIVYGTAWYAPPIVFARNDGNLTRMEVLLAAGEIQSVLKVVVNGIEIPVGRNGKDMTGTGWHSVVTFGARTGAFNTDFTDGAGTALGDPYGSMAMMSVVVPNRISEGRSLPDIQVLVQGMRLPQHDATGTLVRQTFTNNPVWVLLDVLRRCGWRLNEIDLASFARTAHFCDEPIAAEDLHGSTIAMPRFQCNLVLRKRRSAAEVIRGIRTAARLYLTYASNGKLQLRSEASIATEQPVKMAGTNSLEPLNGGWPAYEFGDGSNGFSGIVRRSSGEPSLRIWRRSTAETPNRFTLEFQDALNEYQQDSVSVADEDDLQRTGQEISAGAPALGVANWHQGARVVRLALNKSIAGNMYVEFETSVRAIGLSPGDIITVTYLKEGLARQPFRIVKIQPGLNYSTATITAQIHDDGWYGDAIEGGNPGGARNGRRGTGTPRPLCGTVIDENGDVQLGIAEVPGETADGVGTVTLRTEFLTPPSPAAALGAPLVSMAARVDTVGGTLAGDQTLYYGVTSRAGDGAEGGLSFIVRATVPAGTNTNRVTLTGLSFESGTAGFNVYRGEWPDRLLRFTANQTPATEFTDSGLAEDLAAPPDENYDHANVYWRLELQPETQALLASADAIGNPSLSMEPGAWRGMTVRITRGKGAGQERTVATNSATVIGLDRKWAVTPDATSWFVVAEAGWHFGVRAAASPAEFAVPNRLGAMVHVTGRAASACNSEASAQLSPVTRWRIAGAGAQTDSQPPGAPFFGLAVRGRGLVEVAAVGFEDLANTRTITSGMMTLHYWDELSSPSLIELAADLATDQNTLTLGTAATGVPGGLVQIESEIVRIQEVLDGGMRYRVSRGVLGSTASAHGAGTSVYHLKQTRVVMPFPRDFFGSPASGEFSYSAVLPDIRIAAAELTVRNAKGDSAPHVACYTQTLDYGLRTGSGGQFTMQMDGFVAIQTDATAPIVVQERHAVRNVCAVLREPPMGAPIRINVRQDADVIATLAIAAGDTASDIVSGFGLAPLRAGARIHVDVVSAPQAAGTHPGRDLTVMVRV